MPKETKAKGAKAAPAPAKAAPAKAAAAAPKAKAAAPTTPRFYPGDDLPAAKAKQTNAVRGSCNPYPTRQRSSFEDDDELEVSIHPVLTRLSLPAPCHSPANCGRPSPRAPW